MKVVFIFIWTIISLVLIQSSCAKKPSGHNLKGILHSDCFGTIADSVELTLIRNKIAKTTSTPESPARVMQTVKTDSLGKFNFNRFESLDYNYSIQTKNLSNNLNVIIADGDLGKIEDGDVGILYQNGFPTKLNLEWSATTFKPFTANDTIEYTILDLEGNNNKSGVIKYSFDLKMSVTLTAIFYKKSFKSTNSSVHLKYFLPLQFKYLNDGLNTSIKTYDMSVSTCSTNSNQLVYKY